MGASDSKELKHSKQKQLKKVINKDEFKAIYNDEASLQRQCEAYLDMLQICYIRVPDAIYKSIFGYASNVPLQFKTLISGFIKGLPDITVLFKHGTYLCVELKTKKGRLSLGQKHFRDKVGEENYLVIRSFEEFKSKLKEVK